MKCMKQVYFVRLRCRRMYTRPTQHNHYIFLFFYLFLCFLISLKNVSLPEIRINGIVHFFYISRHLRVCTINTNGLVNQISWNYPRSSSLVLETRSLVERCRPDYQNRPFTFYEKAVMIRGRKQSGSLQGGYPAWAGRRRFIRVYSAARSIRWHGRSAAHTSKNLQAYFGKGTNTRLCGLIGKWNFVIYRGNSAVKRDGGKYCLMLASKSHSVLFRLNIITQKGVYKYKEYWKIYFKNIGRSFSEIYIEIEWFQYILYFNTYLMVEPLF